MRSRLCVLGLVLGLWGVPGFAQTPEEVRPTDEVHKLKLENLQMKQVLLAQQIRELQAQITEAGKKIDEEWGILEGVLRTALTPPADWVLDRQKGAFVPQPKNATPPRP